MALELTYYRDSIHTYAVLPCSVSVTTNSYKYRMIEMNRIDGVLECSVRQFDGKKYIYYDITGRQSMQTLFENKALLRKDVLCFLSSLDKVRGTLADFLLDGDHLVLTTELTYYDFRADAYFFAYNPDSVETEEDIFRFLVEHIDKADHELSASVLRLCAAEEKSDRLQETIRDEIRKLTKSEPESEFADGFWGTEENAESFEAVDIPYSESKIDENTERKKSETSEDQKKSKKRFILRILAIMMIALATAGLFALPELIFMSFVAAKLCRVGSVLMLVADVLIILDTISHSPKAGGTIKCRKKLGKETSTERKIRKDVIHTESITVPPADRHRMSLDHETIPLSSENRIGKLYGNEENRGLRISFDQLPHTIGTAEQYVDSVLNDPSISRMHARFYKDEQGNLYVKDLGSTNGTFINGTRLLPNESKELRRGDELVLGNVELIYR